MRCIEQWESHRKDIPYGYQNESTGDGIVNKSE